MLSEVLKLLKTQPDFFLKLTGEHLAISLFSAALATVLGLGVGMAIAEYKKGASFTLALVNFVYTIPSIALLGFLIPLSGIGNTTAIIALTIYALLPMVRNTYTGLTTIDPKIIEAAEGMGSTPLQLLWKIKLPMAMPVILAGLRNMTTMTVALAGIASFIGAGGLGVAIYRGITTNNTAMTLAGSLLIALLALTLEFLFGLFEKISLKRRRETSKIGWKRPLTAILVLLVIVGSVSFFRPQPQVIHIATKPMTEQYILGNMLKQLIESESDLKVELTTGVGGGTSNIQPGMEKGEFDLYPEYTGTAWNNVLHETSFYTEKNFPQLKRNYEERFDMTFLGNYGFENTYGMAVRKDIAERHRLKTISDLAPVSGALVFGANYDFFERKDGYPGLQQVYNIHFARLVEMDIGLKYQAMANYQIDAMPIFTTDGQLATADVVILEDDKQYYPSYRCINVVRRDVLRKHPELKEILEKTNDLISNEEMTKMNHQVEGENKDPRDVATDFLQKKGLLKEGR